MTCGDIAMNKDLFWEFRYLVKLARVLLANVRRSNRRPLGKDVKRFVGGLGGQYYVHD